MAMTAGPSGGNVSEINVTPLIDVLLVLLIIFMVIIPATPKGLEALAPQPPKNLSTPKPEKTIVVQVRSGAGAPLYNINGQSFAFSDLAPELEKIFSARQEKVMFVKGDPALTFGAVAQVIALGHAANVTTIGVLTPQAEAGH